MRDGEGPISESHNATSGCKGALSPMGPAPCQVPPVSDTECLWGDPSLGDRGGDGGPVSGSSELTKPG